MKKINLECQKLKHWMRWNFNTNEAYQLHNEDEINAGFKVKSKKEF